MSAVAMATALEVSDAPGAVSQAHRHPGFVLGHVIEGQIRAGQMFYEPPGSVQSTAANASAVNAARFLAIIRADQGAPLNCRAVAQSHQP